MIKKAKDLETSIISLQNSHKKGRSYLGQLDQVMDTANPMEFFSFLLYEHPKIANFIQHLNSEPNINFEKWTLASSQPKFPTETMDRLIAQANLLQTEILQEA